MRRSGRESAGAALALALALLAAGCGTETGADPVGAPLSPASASPAPISPAPAAGAAPEPDRADPVIAKVPRAQWRRMVRAGMAYEGCPATRADLRRVEVNHVGFDGDVRRGVLVVNADVAPSIARIFTRLFEKRFPIRRMRPVELYDGDSNASLRDNNTSAYNCRRPSQINAPAQESPHANGRAIDINPVQNPWMDLRCQCWSPRATFNERTPGKGKILEGGTVWKAFRAEGWIWQNIDVPDYMHFDTGYPSGPFGRR